MKKTSKFLHLATFSALTLFLYSAKSKSSELESTGGLKEPTKLYKPLPEYTPPNKLTAHLFLGISANVGLATHKEINKDHQSTQVLGNFQLGYIKNLDSWNFISGEIDFILGQICGGQTDWFAPFGGLAKIGYGYSFSQNFYGVLKGGFGLLKSSYSIPSTDNQNKMVEKKALGTIFYLAYGIEALVSESFMPSAMINYTRAQTEDTLSASSFGLEIGAKFLF